MQILICAATEFEIQLTIDLIQRRSWSDKVDVLITGVGLMSATYAITKHLITKKPALLIQAGVAGCLDESLPLGKVVLIQSETIGDSGVEEAGAFKTLFDLNLTYKNQFPWKNGHLTNETVVLKQFDLPLVNAITVNEISTQPKKIFYYKKMGAAVETLEGAALHYVALQEGLSFLQIRSISNFIGERDKTKWRLDLSIINLNIELEKILSKLLA